MKLLVLVDYTSRELQFKAGQVIEVSDVAGKFLLADAPECFAAQSTLAPAVHTDKKALDNPPVDKMIRQPARKK